MLSRIPGLVDAIPAYLLDEFHYYSVIPNDTAHFATLDGPRRAREAGKLGTRSVRRSLLQRAVVEFAQREGVQFHWGHKLESLEQKEEDVTVTFANGIKESFSFVVGCDGLHSNTRQCLFGTVPADYTGLTQVCVLHVDV